MNPIRGVLGWLGQHTIFDYLVAIGAVTAATLIARCTYMPSEADEASRVFANTLGPRVISQVNLNDDKYNDAVKVTKGGGLHIYVGTAGGLVSLTEYATRQKSLLQQEAQQQIQEIHTNRQKIEARLNKEDEAALGKADGQARIRAHQLGLEIGRIQSRAREVAEGGN